MERIRVFRNGNTAGNVTLPAQCTDWRFGYSICCRNCAITTLVFARNLRGITRPLCRGYVEQRRSADQLFSGILQHPGLFLCIGQVFHYNHGAHNTDGDSITYSFITPRPAANTNVTFNAGYRLTAHSLHPRMSIRQAAILLSPDANGKSAAGHHCPANTGTACWSAV